MVDRDPPVISALALAPARFAAARGTTIRYTLSEPGSVELEFRRAVPGRHVGGACRAVTARTGSGRRCRRYIPAGTLRRAGAGGANRIAFSGRLGERTLRRGVYRLRVRAVDLAGNRSAWHSKGFRVVR